MKVKSDHRSNFFQFKQLERRSLKKIRAPTGTIQIIREFYFHIHVDVYCISDGNNTG